MALIPINSFSAARLEDESPKTFLSLQDHVTNHVSREMTSVLDKLAVSDREAAQRADMLAQMIQSWDQSVSAREKGQQLASEASGISKASGTTLGGPWRESPDAHLDTSGSLVLTKQKQCPNWCNCTCHSRRNLKSPRLLTTLFGEFNVYYSGQSQHLCRCSASFLLSVTYRFPQFLLRRYISFVSQYSNNTGPEFLLRVPNVMDCHHKLWRCLIEGDIAAIQKMYNQGLASPLDVTRHGANSLVFAADHGSAELVNFLIDQGVDCDFPAERGDVPSEMLWDRAYGGMFGEDGAVIVRKVARRNNDLDDMGFSTLHKIILGVIYKDLRMVLQATTDSVNTVDSRGRTPLHWAVICNLAVAVETLLVFGADPNIVDNCGYVAVDFVRSSLICQSLLDAKAHIRTNPTKKGRSALHHAVIRGTPVEVIDLLIDAGVDVDVADMDGETALMNAIYWGRIEIAERLIERGADVNLSNISTLESLIHFASSFDRPKLLPLLLERGADYTCMNYSGYDLGHSAARFAGVEFIHIMSQSRLYRLDLDKRDRYGKTAKDYMTERIVLTDREIGIHEVFEKLAACLATPSKLIAETLNHSNENTVKPQAPMSFNPQVPGAFPESE